jgi:peptide/nickel transport system ATP-binding protein
VSTHTQDGQPLLAVEGLSVLFEGQPAPAVMNASWELQRGQVLAVVGESGSGKSVTAMSVLGLLPATASVTGSIRLATGFDAPTELVGAPPRTLRGVRGGIVGLVSQEPMNAWNPVLTIGSQVVEAIRTHARMSRGGAHARLLALFGEVGLADAERVARSFPHQLSGGQLQRALIAMAISGDPAVLIADEPTTALDVTVQAGILEVLRGLRDTRGTAVLLITHDMGVVADIADDVVVMSAGRIVERAPARTLFAAPRERYTRDLLDAVPHLGGQTRRQTVAALPPSQVPPVDVRDLRVVFSSARGAVRAVDGVTLRIERGAVFGLVGESGSGKSTIGQVLAGLVRPTSGTARVTGLDLAAAPRRELLRVRRGIGIVFQDPASTLNPRWTIGGSVAEPLRLHTRLRGEELTDRVCELLEMVRLSPNLASRYPHELSGGQRQRVAIARAVALDPDVLIADEPTSALDVSVQSRVLDVFRDLQSRLGFACLFISHNLAVVESVADRVAVMHRGRIVEEGPTAQVLGSPTEEYTRRLLAAAPVADPTVQAARRADRLAGALSAPSGG